MIWLRVIIGTFAKVGPDDEDNVEEADSDEDGGEEILSTAKVVFPLDHSVSCSFPPICHWGMHSRKRNTLRWYFSDMRNPRPWRLYQFLHINTFLESLWFWFWSEFYFWSKIYIEWKGFKLAKPVNCWKKRLSLKFSEASNNSLNKTTTFFNRNKTARNVTLSFHFCKLHDSFLPPSTK